MGKYTEFFEDKSSNIYDEDELMEEIKKTITLFRTFDEALDSFIEAHGFVGNIENVEEKFEFIRSKFRMTGVPMPRNIKKWYSEHKVLERKTAFQICFAFGLNIDEADDFLRRVCLFRGFDCHSMEEVVVYFAMKNKLTYMQYQRILKELDIVKPKKIIADDIVYTDFIEDEIEQISSEQELIDYLSMNKKLFQYNNATAYSVILNLWENIANEKGLALKEKKFMYQSFDKDESELLDDNSKQNGRKERKRVDGSLWEIYLQILGLSGNYSSKYYKYRGVKNILNDNELLHPLAEESFPDRDGLNKILNGEHVSYERVRKILILLVFYRFWVKNALQKKDYYAGYGDTERCRNSIDTFLSEVGYPFLYAGNPYDFIFLYANNSEMPLVTFREYMRELFYVKNKSFESEYRM